MARVNRIGIFKLINLIGAGGMSEVYEAEIISDEKYPHRNGKRVALKIQRTGTNAEDFERLMKREIHLLSDLRHPGIVRVYHIAQSDPAQYRARATEIDGLPWYYMMELLTNITLHNLAYDRGYQRRFDLHWKVELLYQVATTLDYLHLRSIAHRDLKPENIVMRQQPNLKQRPDPVLIDFGLTEKRAAEPSVRAMSLSHASPERVEEVVNRRGTAIERDHQAADVWAFGVIAYELLSGQYIYDVQLDRVDPVELGEMIRREPPRPMPGNVPLALRDTVMMMLRKDADTRPDMRRVIHQLERFIEYISPRI